MLDAPLTDIGRNISIRGGYLIRMERELHTIRDETLVQQSNTA